MISNIRTIALISLAASFCATAKDLKTEITVDRTIVPVERDATRLGSLTPQLLSTPVRLRQLTLADYTNPAELTRSASTLEPAAFGNTFELSPYRGYASLAYFPVFNLAASAGYKFIDNSHTRLGAWLQYDGYSYNPTEKDAGGHYSNNSVTVGAAFDQRVGSKSSFGAHFAYTHSALGLPDDFIDNRQNVNIFDGDLSWWSRTGLVGYHIKAAFSRFAYAKDVTINYVEYFDSHPYEVLNPFGIKPAAENRFNFNAGIGFFGSSAAPRGGLEVSADFISRSNGLEYADNLLFNNEIRSVLQPLSTGTLGVISLTPYYAFHAGTFHGRIGAKFDISVAGEGKKFHIAPDVMLDWNLAPQFAVFARFNGGEHLNSLRSLYDYCPFVGGHWQYQRSHIPLTADLGLNIGPFAGFSARIFGGYAAANDWLMPQYTLIHSKEHLIRSELTNFGSYDLKAWHAGLGLSYDWRSIIKAEVTAETASNNGNKAYFLWRDRAKYVINASIEAHPIKPWKIAVGYQLRTNRHNYFFDADPSNTYIPLKLKSISDLSFDAAYAINDAFTVFARGENLLNRRYNIVTDIQAQGIKGLIGVSYKF